MYEVFVASSRNEKKYTDRGSAIRILGTRVSGPLTCQPGWGCASHMLSHGQGDQGGSLTRMPPSLILIPDIPDIPEVPWVPSGA
jgi:hypothetical protein